MAEGSCARIENGRVGGILRDGFVSGVRVARDAKRALRPAKDAIGLAGALPQKQIDLFTGTEDGDGVNVRVQMTGDATDGADRDDAGEKAFVALEDFEARFGPELAAVPVRAGSGRPGSRTRGIFCVARNSFHCTSNAPVAAVLSKFVF